MSLPIASRELVQILRRRNTFILVGLYYGILTLSAGAVWSTLEFSPMNRADAGQGIFWVYLVVAFLFLSFHGTSQAAHTLVDENENKTAEFLQIAPHGSASIVLQKAAVPVVTEWLFFLGTLPFVSLVFFLGGVSGPLFLNQMLNLAVWLNTCLAIGIFVSSRAKRSNDADRIATGLLVLLAALLPFLSRIMLSALQFTDLGLHADWVQRAEIATNWAYHLTPFGMLTAVSEWATSPALVGQGPGWLYPDWKSLWGSHLLLQSVLIFFAVRQWDRTRERVEVMQDGTTRGRWWRRRKFVAKRDLFPEEARAFLDLEDRLVFKGGWRTKRRLIIAWGVVVAGLIALVWIAPGELVETALGGSQMVLTVTGFIILLALLNQSSNSYKREIQNRSAALFLDTPVHPRDAFLWRWRHYMRLGFAAAGVMLVSQLAFWILTYPIGSLLPGVRSMFFFSGISPLLSVCFIPLLAFVGLVSGLYPKQQRFLLAGVVILLFCGGGCVAPLLIPVPFVFALACLLSGPANDYKETKGLFRLRVLTFSVVGLLGFLDLFAIAGIFVPPGRDWLRAYGWYLVLYANAVVLPLACALAAWFWIAGSPLKWWRRRLIGKDAQEEEPVVLPAPERLPAG